MNIFIPIGIGVALLVGIVIFLCAIYKVVPVDKVLIITGGKEPVIKISGGCFVPPFFRKADAFDLCMLTVPADSDEIKTSTLIPIVVDWTAQIRPNTKDVEILKKAIVSFKERGNDGIIDDVRLTLMGAVRGVVATLTPEQVQNDKETFKNEIMKSVSDELTDMGLELVSLNIQEITDNYGYYDDIAAIDREEKRKEAEKVKATANQQIRQQAAESEKIARHSELESELEIAEKAKANDLKKASFQIETDKAKADAEIAGELQRTVREQEIEQEKGKVAVVRQEQANLAAKKEKEVIVTKAQADKEREQINAESQANVRKIEADAQVTVAERKANATKIEAEATAEKIKKEGTAKAEIEKQQGIAEAEVIRQKALAEAEGEKARLLAQAEGERAIAEARASNEKVNYEIEKLKIMANAQIQIATNTATVMANIGQNSEFVNITGLGGNGVGDVAGGNVLIDTLSKIPAMMKMLNIENNALNGKDFNDELSGLVGSVAGPMKGLLVNTGDNSDNAPKVEE